MFRFVVAALIWAILSCGGDPASFGAQQMPIGQAALSHVSAIVALGPRPPGSLAHREMQQYVTKELESAGVVAERIPFVASTPIGPVSMTSIVGRIPGHGDGTVLLATHYDTMRTGKFHFVGANDGGSGTGLLLSLAPLLAKGDYNNNIWLVFLDGEESLEQWSESDSLYGSRYLVAKWKAEGVLPQIRAFFLLDMVGDADLGILRESNSTPWLLNEVWRMANLLGYSRHFLERGMPVEDDHIPFLREGVPAVNLIDFYYGPRGSYWHSAEDTLDKLSAHSLQVVGEVLLDVILELDSK